MILKQIIPQRHLLLLVWMTLWSLQVFPQSYGLTAGGNPKDYTNTKSVIDLHLMSSQLYRSPATRGDGIKANVLADGYVKVEVIMSIRNWVNSSSSPNAFKDQVIYSVKLDRAGNYVSYTYTADNEITYDRRIKFGIISDNESVLSTTIGDDMRHVLQLIRGKFNNVCNQPSWLETVKNYVTGRSEYELDAEGESLQEDAVPDTYSQRLYSVLTGNCDIGLGSDNVKIFDVLRVSAFPIKLKVTIKNATFYAFYHPFIGTIEAADMLNNQSGDGENETDFENTYLSGVANTLEGKSLNDVNLIVFNHTTRKYATISTRPAGSTGHFTAIYKSNSARTPYYRTSADTVSAFLGDILCIAVKKIAGQTAPPTISGIPGVWISPFNATMQFICSPNITPGEFNPFIPWESQTHQKNINTYPVGFQQKVPEWETLTTSEGTSYWVWVWNLQREQYYKKTAYSAKIEFPNTKNYSDGHTQRSEQSAGHQAEFLHYWAKGNVNNVYTPSAAGTTSNLTAPKYTMTIDPDEILYVNSYKMNQKSPENNTKLLMAPTFPKTVGSKTFNLIAWQNTWPEEQTSFSYNASGYPAGGFLLNNYITEYRKYKEYAAGNTSYNTYYDGYLIEDYDTYRHGTPSGRSVNPKSLTSPASCGDSCWFNPSKATGNNTNPGVASITYGGQTYTWRMNVVSPIKKKSSDPRGFYGTIEGTNNPMGWGTPTHYTVKGLQNLPTSDLIRLRLAVVAYRPAGNYVSPWDRRPPIAERPGKNRSRRDVVQQWLLDKTLPVTNPYNVGINQIDPYGGVPYIESEVSIDRDKLTEVTQTGVWDATVKFIAGQSALVLYMDNTILAGRNVVVMDPTMFQFAAPGSSSYPYSKTSLVGTGEIDLQEGEGEKAFEFLNDFRQSNDDTKGYSFGTETYPAQRKFIKTYVLIRGQKVTFTTRDIGIGKTELFMSAGPWPWSGYYDMSRFMPVDSVAKYMTYTIKRITDDYSLSIGSTVQTVTAKNLSYTWNDAGDYAIEIKFMGNSNKTGYVRVIVKDYPATTLDDLTTRTARGTIKTRSLTPQEERWLRKYSEIFTLSSEVQTSLSVGALRMSYLDDVPSLYKFSKLKGPRATSYGDRFGEFNDYNNKYIWYVHGRDPGASTTPVEKNNSAISKYFVKMTAVSSTDYLHTAITDSIFPASWSKVFLRHCSSNHFPSEDVNLTDVLSDPTQTQYKDTVASIFANKYPNQTELGYMRIFPWIAKTPTDGYKVFRFNKGVTNLNAFFNGTNNHNGAWSGTPYYSQIPYVQERMQMTYPTIDDDERNFLEFYNNLYYGRSVIYSFAHIDVDTVYNENPKLASTDTSKPDKIFMATPLTSDYDGHSDDKYLQDLFRNSYRVFEECRNSTSHVYYENYKPDKSAFIPTSSSSVNGMALIALCIAHRMNWDKEAELKAEQTLAALSQHLRPNPLQDNWGGLDKATDEWSKLHRYDLDNIFSLAVTSNGGYPYHYFSVTTGYKIDASHNTASTIDAAILCYGAMFARKYFSNNPIINACAKELYNSIDWNAAFKSSTQIYQAITENGVGDEAQSVSYPFNEYTILAYLAANQTARTPSSSATSFLSNSNSAMALSPEDLLTVYTDNATEVQKFFRFKKFTSYYKAIETPSLPAQIDKSLYTLSDDRSRDGDSRSENSLNKSAGSTGGGIGITAFTHTMPSNFTTQFSYYLCHAYTTSPNFLKYLKSSAAADYTYWRHDLDEQSYFGCGAGSSPSGYSADAPFNNSLKIVSPHIAIGFLPITEESPTADSYFRLKRNALTNLIVKWCKEYNDVRYENAGLKYVLGTLSSRPYVLWRLSKHSSHLTWQPTDISLLDFSTELFGLASIYLKPSTTNPTITAANFFEKYNNIFDATVIPQESNPDDSSIWSWGRWLFHGGGSIDSNTSSFTKSSIKEEQAQDQPTYVSASQPKGLIVYPNPTNGVVNIVLPVGKDTSVKITVNSISGQEVYSDQFVTDEDKQTKQLSLLSLSNGIYILTVSNDQKQVIGRSKVIFK